MNYINPINRPPMDLEKIKKEYGVRASSQGNIDLVHTLSCGTIEAVEAEGKKRISKNRFKSIKKPATTPCGYGNCI